MPLIIALTVSMSTFGGYVATYEQIPQKTSKAIVSVFSESPNEWTDLKARMNRDDQTMDQMLDGMR